MENLLKRVDHLVLAVPDLHQGMEQIFELTGVKPQIGGQHIGRGTWNALLSIGHDAYLELIAPDPKQGTGEAGCWMGVDEIQEPTLIHWAAKVHPIHAVIERAKGQDFSFGKLSAGSRTRMNGQVISWTLTEPVKGEDGGLIPFLIDWEDSDHPAESLPQRCRLIHLEGKHPKPEKINAQIALLNLTMKVNLGNRPQLLASIETPNGVVSLL